MQNLLNTVAQERFKHTQQQTFRKRVVSSPAPLARHVDGDDMATTAGPSPLTDNLIAQLKYRAR